MLLAFGATKTALPYAADYTSIILYGAPLLGTSFVLNHALRAQGRNVLSMIGLTAGGVLNIIYLYST
ncbi:MAG TPA: hypothetical protein GXZ89_04925 [Fastidiosipila sp.]|nr:hypothetical protein [Fastidiosipila sp.]